MRVALPRSVVPGTCLLVTRRCTQRQFLLRPDAATNNAFVYCLALAAQRSNVDVLNFVQMSNHLHVVLYDRHGNAPEFYEHFHKLLAKCMNALRGRWQNFFASEQTSVVRLDTTADVINKIVYVATNPVNDGLVERVAHWPGSSGYRALLDGSPLQATRPAHFFAPNGSSPASIELQLRIPSEVGDAGAVLGAVRLRVETDERERAAERSSTGRSVVGPSAVRRQSWRTAPTSHEVRRGLRPNFAGTFLTRVEAIHRRRVFLSAYRQARNALLVGLASIFPQGTYWLARFAGVRVEVRENC